LDLTDPRVCLAGAPHEITDTDILYNWAAIIRSTGNLIKSRSEQVKEMDQALRREVRKMDQALRREGIQIRSEDVQTHVNEIAQGLQALGDPNTNQIPNPRELDPEDQILFNTLKRNARLDRCRMYFTQGRTVDHKRVDPEKVMARGISNFENLLISFEQYEQEIRTQLALKGRIPSDMDDLLFTLVDMLEDVFNLNQLIKESSKVNKFKNINEITSTIQDISAKSEAAIEPIQNLRDKQDEEARERARNRIEAQTKT
jgi:hypothetical protein